MAKPPAVSTFLTPKAPHNPRGRVNGLTVKSGGDDRHGEREAAAPEEEAEAAAGKVAAAVAGVGEAAAAVVAAADGCVG